MKLFSIVVPLIFMPLNAAANCMQWSSPVAVHQDMITPLCFDQQLKVLRYVDDSIIQVSNPSNADVPAKLKASGVETILYISGITPSRRVNLLVETMAGDLQQIVIDTLPPLKSGEAPKGVLDSLNLRSPKSPLKEADNDL